MSPVDEELLSAYLDGVLPEAERLTLERRLAAEPDLRTGLDDLRRTVAVLKATPQLAPPRNFTLDPAVYGRRSARTTSGWLRLGAVLAALLIIVSAVVFIVYRSNSSLPTQTSAVALQPTSIATSGTASRESVAALPSTTTSAKFAITALPTATTQLRAASATDMPRTQVANAPAPTQAATVSVADQSQRSSTATQVISAGSAAPLKPTASPSAVPPMAIAPLLATNALPTMTPAVAAAQSASGNTSADAATPAKATQFNLLDFLLRLLRQLFGR